MANDNTGLLGKKIFFIHPSAFVQNNIMIELIQQEYEVYAVRDEAKLQKLLQTYPDSIVFASIDEVLPSDKWEAWIRSVMEDEATKTVSIGILSNTDNEGARRFYLNTVKVNCGFTSVKMDKKRVTAVLADLLKTAGAKGRRRHLRADTRGETGITINVPHDGGFINGEIRDISVVGLSCVFDQDPGLEKNSFFPDIQIKLQSALLKTEGIVFGFRMDGSDKVYVFVFTPKTDPAVHVKIRSYIQKNLQSRMDAELK
ncbi:MAG: PilZ domain-containing protein [Treponema sp.]|nr:PilZ domain-containing protein [Treponema sp.]